MPGPRGGWGGRPRGSGCLDWKAGGTVLPALEKVAGLCGSCQAGAQGLPGNQPAAKDMVAGIVPTMCGLEPEELTQTGSVMT